MWFRTQRSKWEKLSTVTKIIYISEVEFWQVEKRKRKKNSFFSDNFSRFRWRMRAIFWGVVLTEFGRCSPPIKTIKKTSHCLKITQKVSFNIASEASYVYILSGQKFIKNAKNGTFWRVFCKPEVYGQTVLPDMSLL